MKWMMAVLATLALVPATGCGKSLPPTTGSNAYATKDGAWVTFGWSRNRMSYVIYFVPSTTFAFNAEGVAATAKPAKEGDTFTGAFDGYADKSKAPFKVDAKNGIVTIDGKPYRTSNGAVFLVQVGPPTKVQQLMVPLSATGPKDPEELPAAMDAEIKKITAENPKLKEFPKEPPPEKPSKKK